MEDDLDLVAALGASADAYFPRRRANCPFHDLAKRLAGVGPWLPVVAQMI